MPVAAWMSITGETGGNISEGANTKASIGSLGKEDNEHKDKILVWAYDHTVELPTDLVSGGVTGDRVHKEVTIIKMFDKSSPKLYKALAEGDVLTVEIKFYHMEGADKIHFFTVEMEAAKITKIRAWMPNFQDKTQAHLQQMENVSFRFTRIIWTDIAGGASHNDDWGE